MTSHAWYHTIDLPDGTTTEGWSDTRNAATHVRWPETIAGGRCLDVGTFDGFWAFEMERHGAREVLGLDIDDPDDVDWPYDTRASGPVHLRARGSLMGRGFEEAKLKLGSSATRICLSVYNLDPAVHGRFDVVNCGALILHLAHPVLALERMREVCSGELVLIESLDPVLEIAARRTPAARFAPEPDKWWRANTAGLLAMVDRAGFDVTWLSPRFLVPHGPGWKGRQAGLLNSVAARRLGSRGGLHRALRARPRLPRGT